MKPLSPTFYGNPDPYQPETQEELERDADIRAVLRNIAGHYAAALPFLELAKRLGAPCYGRDWDDVIDEAADMAKAVSPEAIKRLEAADAAKLREYRIAQGMKAEALEKAMKS